MVALGSLVCASCDDDERLRRPSSRVDVDDNTDAVATRSVSDGGIAEVLGAFDRR
jgi:hypothetical protein